MTREYFQEMEKNKWKIKGNERYEEEMEKEQKL